LAQCDSAEPPKSVDRGLGPGQVIFAASPRLPDPAAFEDDVVDTVLREVAIRR
jgi:hypothetical protein